MWIAFFSSRYQNNQDKDKGQNKFNHKPAKNGHHCSQYHDNGSFKEKDNRTPEQEELMQLRKENKKLTMENDSLKQAALIMGRK